MTVGELIALLTEHGQDERIVFEDPDTCEEVLSPVSVDTVEEIGVLMVFTVREYA